MNSMDDERVSEHHKLINMICDPRIRPFVDSKKLCESSIFDDAVETAIDHVAKHGNLTLLNNVLALLDGTPHARKFVARVLAKVDCVITDTKPQKFRKTASREKNVAVAILPPKRPAANVAMATASMYVEEERSAQDIMDSRLILPGSYGAGRRG